MAANEKEIEAQTAIAKRNNELNLAKSTESRGRQGRCRRGRCRYDPDKLACKGGQGVRGDAEIAKQKKMVDLAAQEAEVQQRKLDAEVRKQADAELYRRQKQAEAQKYEAERAAEAAKFAKQQEAEGIALVGKAEAEAIRQKQPGRGRSNEAKSRSLQAVQRRRCGRNDDQGPA